MTTKNADSYQSFSVFCMQMNIILNGFFLIHTDEWSKCIFIYKKSTEVIIYVIISYINKK